MIPEKDRDKNLGAKLEAEASGILNWALEGLRQYQSQGLRIPSAVVQATATYREGQNLVARFIEDRTEPASTFESVDAAELFQAYKDWARDGSEFVLSQTKFGVEAKKLLVSKKDNAGRIIYQGIKIRDVVQPGIIARSVGF